MVRSTIERSLETTQFLWVGAPGLSWATRDASEGPQTLPHHFICIQDHIWTQRTSFGTVLMHFLSLRTILDIAGNFWDWWCISPVLMILRRILVQADLFRKTLAFLSFNIVQLVSHCLEVWDISIRHSSTPKANGDVRTNQWCWWK
jgi:hypothetical protein